MPTLLTWSILAAPADGDLIGRIRSDEPRIRNQAELEARELIQNLLGRLEAGDPIERKAARRELESWTDRLAAL